MAFRAPEPQASLARNELKTLACQKWAFPPTLHFTFYARVAFLAPEPQASLARNELKTVVFDLQVSATRCARAALAVQAHGAPLVHKNSYDLQLVAREVCLRFRRMERPTHA